jgi:hypothetical protein
MQRLGLCAAGVRIALGASKQPWGKKELHNRTGAPRIYRVVQQLWAISYFKNVGIEGMRTVMKSCSL